MHKPYDWQAEGDFKVHVNVIPIRRADREAMEAEEKHDGLMWGGAV